MHWKTKAAVFRLLDTLPFGKAFHYSLQRHFTKNWPRSESDVRALFEAARKTIDQFQMYSYKALSDAIFLEVGTGRDLTIPLAVRALGVSRIITIDVERLARLELVNSAASIIGKIPGTPMPVFDSWDAVSRFGIDYRAPNSIDTVEISPDAFISNEVLEHIPPPALKDIVATAHAILPDGGLVIHAIDYSDHYARGGSVSRYNFLCYSANEWRRYNSGFQYVNRLRHSEFVRIFESAGFTLLSDEPYAAEIPSSILSNLANEFRQFSVEDLSIMRSRIVARKREA